MVTASQRFQKSRIAAAKRLKRQKAITRARVAKIRKFRKKKLTKFRGRGRGLNLV